MTWRPEICIYHGNCQDGFGAAWAVWKRWPDCEFAPAIYGKPLPDVTGKDVLMVDFSAKAEHLRASGARSLVVIDHHKTAQADLAELPTFDGSLEAIDFDHGIAVHFDMERSGAVLTWMFCHPAMAVPKLLEFIQDRDLWQFRWIGSREIHAFLSSYPFDFELWSQFAREIELPDGVPRFVGKGESVLRVHRQNTQKLLADAYMGSIDGHDVPMVNAPYNYASDVGNDLLTLYPDAPFAATWYYRSDGKVQFSLRSTDERADVSAIAKARGGGGHRNAAGFESQWGTIVIGPPIDEPAEPSS